MGRIYNSAYCNMLRDELKAKNPELKRSSKEISAIDNMATVADMLVLEARDLKFMRGGENNIAGDLSMIKVINEKYPDVYTFLSNMYNDNNWITIEAVMYGDTPNAKTENLERAPPPKMFINPNTDAEKKVADKDGFIEMNIDHTLRVLENLK